jgi:uncharacterized damage-inducible protein DinB
MEAELETWRIHDRINQYLLNSFDESFLNAQSASKGRTVGEQFAHIHHVRLMWIKAADPERLENLNKIEKSDILIDTLKSNLLQSGEAIEELLKKGFSENRIKNFKPHPMAFLGYLISHESHHRGQILLSLKQSGIILDKKILFGIWEWGTR